MITNDIFIEIIFKDTDGHIYGKIVESEFAENEYVFLPTDNEHEIDNKMLDAVQNIIKSLNNNL